MKKSVHSNKKIPPRLVRIDESTWIENRDGEPDETVRRNFLMKLARYLDSPHLQTGV
ncbi:MAG TPA: hypothetical protein PLV06_03645 [Bacteroidales bacterium]|nr:hypothetical protein [Bacteroidales bacterium]HPF02057.1 hypothetical protein [Bacteroidales bacterium]HPJ60037.1 hypothetical protein [Bacteroidales bacterium]HPR11456.1 hypothetical protein [Bacteroidales bacterium]HRW86119.1 hypothetical protein [Bacteroidales bacterium]